MRLIPFTAALIAAVVMATARPAQAETICNPYSPNSNLRGGPSAKTFPVLKSLPNGTTVTILGLRKNEAGNDWLKVRTANKTEGYIAASAVAFGCPVSSLDHFVVNSNDGYVNLRSRPATSGTALHKITNGTPLRRLAQNGNWIKVRSKGTEGWVFLSALKSTAVIKPAISPKTSPPKSSASKPAAMSRYAAPEGKCYIQTALRQTRSKAQAFVTVWDPIRVKNVPGLQWKVFRTTENDYAITLGIISKNSFDTIRKKASLPSTASCSSGKSYAERFDLIARKAANPAPAPAAKKTAAPPKKPAFQLDKSQCYLVAETASTLQIARDYVTSHEAERLKSAPKQQWQLYAQSNNRYALTLGSVRRSDPLNAISRYKKAGLITPDGECVSGAMFVREIPDSTSQLMKAANAVSTKELASVLDRSSLDKATRNTVEARVQTRAEAGDLDAQAVLAASTFKTLTKHSAPQFMGQITDDPVKTSADLRAALESLQTLSAQGSVIAAQSMTNINTKIKDFDDDYKAATTGREFYDLFLRFQSQGAALRPEADLDLNTGFTRDLLTVAYEKGALNALPILEKMSRGDPDPAQHTAYLATLAEKGANFALLALAKTADDEGRAKDAFDLRLKAADMGAKEAFLPVAEAYRSGTVVPADGDRAAKYYALAANRGNPEGALGLMLIETSGPVPKNPLPDISPAASVTALIGQAKDQLAKAEAADTPMAEKAAYQAAQLAAVKAARMGDPSALTFALDLLTREHPNFDLALALAPMAEANTPYLLGSVADLIEAQRSKQADAALQKELDALQMPPLQGTKISEIDWAKLDAFLALAPRLTPTLRATQDRELTTAALLGKLRKTLPQEGEVLFARNAAADAPALVLRSTAGGIDTLQIFTPSGGQAGQVCGQNISGARLPEGLPGKIEIWDRYSSSIATLEGKTLITGINLVDPSPTRGLALLDPKFSETSAKAPATAFLEIDAELDILTPPAEGSPAAKTALRLKGWHKMTADIEARGSGFLRRATPVDQVHDILDKATPEDAETLADLQALATVYANDCAVAALLTAPETREKLQPLFGDREQSKRVDEVFENRYGLR